MLPGQSEPGEEGGIRPVSAAGRAQSQLSGKRSGWPDNWLPGDARAMADVFIRAWRQAYPGVVPDAIIAELDHDQTARTGGPAPRLTVTYQELPGRSAEGYPVVSQLLIRQLASGVPPGLAMEVRSSAATAYSAAGGWAKLTGSAAGADLVTSAQGPVEVGAGTLFDLASLTKVIATLPLVLLLHQRGQWSIDDPVARWLPGAPRSPVTISDCLLHIAGLVPFRQYYLTCDGPAEIKRAVTAELAGAAAGPVSYSDVGFMLLGWAIENCAGETLAGLFAREVAGPLGMTSTSYLPEAPRQHIAATEADGDQRTNPVLVWGEVHDGNAFALGGTSGHAGLFGTAADLGRFASALLRPDHHPVLSAETIALMTSRHTGADPEARVLGWRVRPDQWGSWPAGTIWHTGFTGTSMLIAPTLDAAIVLLTNAVHPARRGAEIAEFRTKVHQAVRTVLDGSPGPHDTGMPAAEASSARSRS